MKLPDLLLFFAAVLALVALLAWGGDWQERRADEARGWSGPNRPDAVTWGNMP